MKQLHLIGLFLVMAGSTASMAQGVAPDSSEVYTFVERMPAYLGGKGYLVLLTDLRREFAAASSAAGCPVPTFPVNVNLVVGPSGVIYHAEFVNNLPLNTTKDQNVANTPPGPALPATCEMALTTAVHKLPRLQPGTQNQRPVTVRLTVPLVTKS